MYKQYYIYFMMSDNRNALYIGVTDNLERRVKKRAPVRNNPRLYPEVLLYQPCLL